MFKRDMLVVLSCIAVGVASAVAQQADDPLELRPVVNGDDAWELSYEHHRSQNGETTSATIGARVSVTGLTDEGYTAEWTTTSITVNGQKLTSDDPEATQLFVGVPISYEALLDGGPVRVLDREALIEDIFSSAAFTGLDETVLQATRNMFDAMTDEGLAQSLLKVPSMISLCQWTSLVPGELYESESEVPSNFGSMTIRNTVQYETSFADENHSVLNVRYASIMNQEDLTLVILKTLEELAPGNKISAADRKLLKQMKQEDRADCRVSTTTGLVESMAYNRTVKIPGQSRIEDYQIEINALDE